jgi:hypothetical protein
MKNTAALFLLMSALLLTTSTCKKWDEESGPTDIRIRNLSEQVFDSIYVDTSEKVDGSDSFTFNTLNPDAETTYHRFTKAYRQALLKVYISGVRYTFTPVGYTYEVYLGRGKFTYEIWTEGSNPLVIKMQVGADIYPLD